MNVLLFWISGALFMGSAWQLHDVTQRQIHGEPYSLPFFVVTTDKKARELKGKNRDEFSVFSQHSFWGDVWMAGIVLSYLILFISILWR